MLLGVPAVSANVGGVSSIFTDKEDGLLFEMGDVKALADSVIYMFDNPKIMENYSRNAREHAKNTHNPEANYKRLLEIYQEIV